MLFGAFVALLVAVPTVIAQAFMINTPTGITACQPSRITWTGGSPPYILTLTEGVTTGGVVLKEFDGLTGTGFTWLVDLQANTNFILNLKDSTGVIAQSASVTVAAGGSTSCLNTSVNESASGVTSDSVSAAPAPAPTSAGVTTPVSSPSGASAPAPTPTPTTPAASSATTPSGSSSGSAPAASTKGAASHLSASSVCITGLMGLLGAILY